MSRDKAEIISERKLRLSNGNTSKSKSDEKKTRESSTDRTNLKNTSLKKTEPAKSTPRQLKDKSVVSKTLLRSNTIEKKSTTSTTSRTNLPKTTPKPMKALKSTTSSTSINSTPRGTKSSSRDITSSRVTKQQYFPQKYAYSARLHENEANPAETPKKANGAKPERIVDRKPGRTVEKRPEIKPERTKTREIKSYSKPERPKDRKLVKTSERTKIKAVDSNPIDKSPPKLTRERTRIRILSEIKLPKQIEQEPNNNETIIERPRTATIRKHYDEPPPEIDSIEKEPEPQQAENDYEDDFESYESDFEAGSSTTSGTSAASIATDSSSSSDSESLPVELTQKRINSAGNEEERKLDSGNYDLPDVKHKQILDKIKEAIEKENSELTKHKNDTVNPASLSDEGFEDSYKYSLSNNGFINFLDAKKKLEQKHKRRNRGDDLMNMIRLNAISFSLYDMNPISYDEFMQSYGRSGTIQMSAQTGDDDLDEEVQTERIETQDNWTQYPIRFSKNDQPDKPRDSTLNTTKNLAKFVSKQGKLMLHILEKKNSEKLLRIDKNNREIPFSDGYLKLSYEQVPFLKDRAVTFLTYSKNGALLTVHASVYQTDMNYNEQLLRRSTICVWNIFEANTPRQMLVSSGEIYKACFDSGHGYLIFAGINDGAISVWDLRESSKFHREIHDENSNETYTMRSATYTTISSGNTGKIVEIQAFPSNTAHIDQISAQQICTLDEIGTVIIWSVIQRQVTPELLSDDQGLVPWGRVILVQGLVISLQKQNPNLRELHCFGLQFSEEESNHLYITSNYGVLHCLSSGMKPKPRLYTSINDKSSAQCVEMCPFSATHFLSGCENGNIHLHSRFYEKPLMTLCNSDETKINQSIIESIEWSNGRPCIFFVKDSANFIHIWDLTASDMYPIFSIPFNENISEIKLSPILARQSSSQLNYMAIATKTGNIFLHVLNNEYTQKSPEQYQTELKKFFNYVHRL